MGFPNTAPTLACTPVEKLLLLYTGSVRVSVTTDLARSCYFAYRRKMAPYSDPPYFTGLASPNEMRKILNQGRLQHRIKATLRTIVRYIFPRLLTSISSCKAFQKPFLRIIKYGGQMTWNWLETILSTEGKTLHKRQIPTSVLPMEGEYRRRCYIRICKHLYYIMQLCVAVSCLIRSSYQITQLDHKLISCWLDW